MSLPVPFSAPETFDTFPVALLKRKICSNDWKYTSLPIRTTDQNSLLTIFSGFICAERER